MPESEALLGKARAWCSTLAGLELWIGLADHIDSAFALHDLTIGVTALGGGEGRENFHGQKGFWVGARSLAGGRKTIGIVSSVKAFLGR